MPSLIDQNIASKLHVQLGNYGEYGEIAERVLAYEGGEEFRQGFQGAAADTTAREAFIDYLTQFVPELPEAGGRIVLQDLLGEEGRKLYQAALKEESRSPEFLRAVLGNSSTEIDKVFAERPVIFIGGPSASGKTFSRDAVLDHLAQTEGALAETEGEKSFVTSIDGGLVRETSQMRKLAIQLALNHGYAGIEDLENHSKSLKDSKKALKQSLLKSKKLALVIPKTFTYVFSRQRILEKLFSSYFKLDNARFIFANITSTNQKRFKNVVSGMGESRAWGESETSTDYDLNKTGLPESKAYDKGGFKLGLTQSKLARNVFSRMTRGKKHKGELYDINNDLMMIRLNEQSEWEETAEWTKDCMLISEQVFKRYEAEKLQITDKKQMKAFIKTCDVKPQITEVVLDKRSAIADQMRAASKTFRDLAKSRKLRRKSSRDVLDSGTSTPPEQPVATFRVAEPNSTETQRTLPHRDDTSKGGALEDVSATHYPSIQQLEEGLSQCYPVDSGITYEVHRIESTDHLLEVKFRDSEHVSTVTVHEDEVSMPVDAVNEQSAEHMMRVFILNRIPSWDGETLPPVYPDTQEPLSVSITCGDPVKLQALQHAAEDYHVEILQTDAPAPGM